MNNAHLHTCKKGANGKKKRCLHCEQAIEILEMIGLIKPGERQLIEPPDAERRKTTATPMHGAAKGSSGGTTDPGGVKAWRRTRDRFALPPGLRELPSDARNLPNVEAGGRDVLPDVDQAS